MTMFAQWKMQEHKWNLDVPWMSKLERVALAKMRESGVSSFRVAICQGRPNGEQCYNEVPNATNEQGQQGKRYCSKACYNSIEDKPDETA